MLTTKGWERRRVLIVVKTYPTPARRGVEVSCTAAITEDGEWLRLFPIPYRSLTDNQKFQKFQWVDVDMQRSDDPRPESYRVDIDSLTIVTKPIPPNDKWHQRKEKLFPLKAHCLCCLQKQQRACGAPTLGLLKPREITAFSIQKDDEPNWTPRELALLNQASMFDNAPTHVLEKVPYHFYYSFRCDHDGCNGHRLSCTDWELEESYRKWRRIYGANWEAKFRETYETRMIFKADTHFYVGTVRQHPNSWIIVGLFYPPKEEKHERMETMRLL
jgi:hypothetical protein